MQYVLPVLWMTSCLHIIRYMGVRRGLRLKDVIQRGATRRGTELQRFSSAPLCVAFRWLASLGHKHRRPQRSLAV